MGTPARELIESYAGGVLDGKSVKAWTPGGTSTPLLTGEDLDTAMDFESVQAAGSLLGTAAMIVMDERDCVVEAVLRMIEFYAHESCGKCTPCREGSSWLVQTMRRIVDGRGRKSDLETLVQLCQNIAGRTVCAFGDAEVAPIMSTLKYWRSEYEELIQQAEAAGLIQLEPAAARH